MTELRALYTLWLREIKRFIRDRARVVISFVQPLLWLVVFAAGFGARLTNPGHRLSTVPFPRHHRANATVHSHVHGHQRDLGQRIRFHERNPCFTRFPIHDFHGQNVRRQHSRTSSRRNRFCFRFHLRHPI